MSFFVASKDLIKKHGIILKKRQEADNISQKLLLM